MLNICRTESRDPKPTNFTQDEDSLRTIAALLVDEIQAYVDSKLAQEIQLSFFGQERQNEKDPVPPRKRIKLEEDVDDHLTSLYRQLDDVNSTLSKNEIVSMCSRESRAVADHIQATQLDQAFAAAATKEQLDREFARVLQETDDRGMNSDQVARGGIEKALGVKHVQELMLSLSLPDFHFDVAVLYIWLRAEIFRHAWYQNSAALMKIQGGAAGGPPTTSKQTRDYPSSSHSASQPMPKKSSETLPTCSICFETVVATRDPYSASLHASSSRQHSYGMYLGPREHAHVVCLECFEAYIKNRLNDGTSKAFPMKCVEVNCPYVLTDEDAKLGLGESNLGAWHFRKLLDSEQAFYCPKSSCSARLTVDASGGGSPQGTCPQCQTLLCMPCKSIWHARYTCEQLQSLPPEERNPEDLAMFDIARREGYSRCPGCRAMLELVAGCYHMTCTYGVESCYLCGLPWSRQPHERVGSCSRNPPCPLADERHLLRPENRDRNPNLLAAPLQQGALPRRPAEQVVAPNVRVRQNIRQDDAARDPDVLHGYALRRARRFGALRFVEYGLPARNRFSAEMTRLSRCGYCDEYYGNLRELREHLADLHHSVLACCGTLFRTQFDLNQHLGKTGGAHDPHRWIVTH